jgi:hypothetical protein
LRLYPGPCGEQLANNRLSHAPALESGSIFPVVKLEVRRIRIVFSWVQ